MLKTTVKMDPSHKTQYQHFIPQFLLRNFAHTYTQPRGQRRRPKGMHPGEKVVHNVDLTQDPYVVTETPVKRILGQLDMYRDEEKATPEEQQEIEALFSKTESRVSPVFRKITKAYEDSEAGLWIMREERDILRKFLFLLSYRNAGQHKRFHHHDAERYNMDDRELLHDYMKKRHFKTPTAVWLHNLKTIMDIEMDLEMQWQRELPKLIFPLDALGFITHITFYYMAICTPSNSLDEFILSDNAYSVFQGPNYSMVDKRTGKTAGWQFTPLHYFAPISPKLIIVLRANMFPIPYEDDADSRVKEWRENARFLSHDAIFQSKVETSLLAGLPVTKARNNYSKIVNGQLVILEGKNWSLKHDHKFEMRFFRLETDWAQKINLFFFDNAYDSTNIVFGSPHGFLKALEYFMEAPADFGKLAIGEHAEPREVYLLKLAALAKALGSTIELVWSKDGELIVGDIEDHYRLATMKCRRLTEILTDDTDEISRAEEYMRCRQQDSSFRSTYEALGKCQKRPPLPRKADMFDFALGGSLFTIAKDMDQARRMWKLRTKIDVWSKGLDEAVRNTARELLAEEYLQLSPRRVWLYTFRITMAAFQQATLPPELWADPSLEFPQELWDDSPSHTMAKGERYLPIQETRRQHLIQASQLVRHLIQTRKLSHNIYHACMNQAHLKEYDNLDIWSGAGWFFASHRLRYVVFQQPGNSPSLQLAPVNKILTRTKSRLHPRVW